MDNAVTVKELLEECKKLVKMGYGDKTVLISSDDEGNEFHTLFYGFTYTPSEVKQIAECCWFHDRNNPDDVVILG